jgi:hypothetical protein
LPVGNPQPVRISALTTTRARSNFRDLMPLRVVGFSTFNLN